jgi:holo-[acyl-carrier protein] synthase
MIAIGTDLIEIARIEQALNRFSKRLVERVLTPEEQQVFARKNNSVAWLAKRFAAKEAISKALGCGIGKSLSFQDISVLNEASGAPVVIFSTRGEALMNSKGASQCLISISDERCYALAFAALS